MSLLAIKSHVLFRNSNLRLVWLSQIISQMGDKIFQLALIWWILNQGFENSGLLLGILLVSSVTPAVILKSSIARVIASSPMKRLLQSLDLGGLAVSAALCLLLFSLFGGGQDQGDPSYLLYSVLVVSNLLFSCCQAFIGPTLNASVSKVSDPEDLEGAVSMLSSATTVAQIMGAVAGAVLLEALGLTGVVILNALTFLISFGLDSSLRIQANDQNSQVSPNETTIPSDTSKPSPGAWTDRLPHLKKLLLVFAAVNLFGTPILVLLPLYIQQSFGGEASRLALSEGVLSFGILMGTLLTSFISKTLTKGVSELRLVSLCLALFGLGLGLVSLPKSFSLFCLVLLVTTFTLGLMNVKMLTYFQTHLGEGDKADFFAHLQSRVLVAVPIGYFLFGTASDYLAVQSLSLVQGTAILGLSGVAFWIARSHEGSKRADTAPTDLLTAKLSESETETEQALAFSTRPEGSVP